MLDQNDLKQIQSVVQGALVENNKALKKDIVSEVAEFIEQSVLTQIDALPDRDFITRKTDEIKGVIIARLRIEDQKVNLLIKFLRDQKILTDEQLKALQEFEVFPSVDQLVV